MNTQSAEDPSSLVLQLEAICDRVKRKNPTPQYNILLIDNLDQLAKLALDREQRGLLGNGRSKLPESITFLWDHIRTEVYADDTYVEQSSTQDVLLRLARLTRNLAAQCPNNQEWILSDCEPNIRQLLHFFTAWYYAEKTEYHQLTTVMTQCLVNTITENERVTAIIWQEYMRLYEKDNIITRLLEYPDRKAVLATLVFILNALSVDPSQSQIMAQNVGGRLVCAKLLDKSDKIFDDEENEELFNLIYSIFTTVFENTTLELVYNSLQSTDGAVSLHQITLLKLLDAYTHSEPTKACTNASIAMFLPKSLLLLLKTTKAWISTDSEVSNTESEPNLNENLPQMAAATVLVSQTLANVLVAEQLEWERSSTSRAILETLRTPSTSFVELIIDVLRRLDQLLPRIQFGKAKPTFGNSHPSINQPGKLDGSGFQFLKRDLVRLLGIISHGDSSIQARIRECGGVQLVLGLCAIDENNPFIREHAIFALRNLLHKNPENQRIVQEMEPMGKIDENGVLVGL